jgi:hypothetical protein
VYRHARRLGVLAALLVPICSCAAPAAESLAATPLASLRDLLERVRSIAQRGSLADQDEIRRVLRLEVAEDRRVAVPPARITALRPLDTQSPLREARYAFQPNAPAMGSLPMRDQGSLDLLFPDACLTMPMLAAVFGAAPERPLLNPRPYVRGFSTLGQETSDYLVLYRFGASGGLVVIANFEGRRCASALVLHENRPEWPAAEHR